MIRKRYSIFWEVNSTKHSKQRANFKANVHGFVIRIENQEPDRLKIIQQFHPNEGCVKECKSEG